MEKKRMERRSLNHWAARLPSIPFTTAYSIPAEDLDVERGAESFCLSWPVLLRDFHWRVPELLEDAWRPQQLSTASASRCLFQAAAVSVNHQGLLPPVQAFSFPPPNFNRPGYPELRNVSFAMTTIFRPSFCVWNDSPWSLTTTLVRWIPSLRRKSSTLFSQSVTLLGR